MQTLLRSKLMGKVGEISAFCENREPPVGILTGRLASA